MTKLPAPSTLDCEPSFGFGDRLGCATTGHLLALREAGGPIRGVFAQQSIREMTRTERTPDEVMSAATAALAAADFGEPWSADADHLKTPADVRQTMAAGFVFFTLDPSDHVDQQADSYAPQQLDERFAGPNSSPRSNASSRPPKPAGRRSTRWPATASASVSRSVKCSAVAMTAMGSRA